METSNVWVAIIGSIAGSGILAAVLDWLRNRKKDAAAAKLTDVQALAAQLSYVEGVAEYLRKHNDDLQKDYTELEDKYRKIRTRCTELEEEIAKVKRSAAQTQEECEKLSEKLNELLGSDQQ